jgi:nucleoside-diphosphate kinase
MQKTFTILKPDTVQAGKAGAVIGELEKAGFRVRAVKMLHLTEAQAQ